VVEREPDGTDGRRGRLTVSPTLTEPATAGPTWSSWREAAVVVRYRPHLRRTIGVALVVGTILFLINQLDVVLAGDVAPRTYLKIGLTYVVPFCVANYGILIASRRRLGWH
jgi:hypothetical protein